MGEIDHLQARGVIRDIGILARQRHAVGLARQPHTGHEVKVVGVVDAVGPGRTREEQPEQEDRARGDKSTEAYERTSRILADTGARARIPDGDREIDDKRSRRFLAAA